MNENLIQTIRDRITETQKVFGKKTQIMVLSPIQFTVLDSKFRDSVSDQDRGILKGKVKALLRAAGFTGYEPWILFEGVYCIQRVGFDDGSDPEPEKKSDSERFEIDPSHPEYACNRCGRRIFFNYAARSEVWNQIMRDGDGNEKEPVVCVDCFVESCSKAGVMAEFVAFHSPYFNYIKLEGMGKNLIYLASPYSDPDPDVEEKRFQTVCVAGADLFMRGSFVFSPIAHCHALAVTRADMGRAFDTYAKYSILMIEKCERFMVVKLPGWETSIGVQAEIKFAESIGRKIEYIEV